MKEKNVGMVVYSSPRDVLMKATIQPDGRDVTFDLSGDTTLDSVNLKLLLRSWKRVTIEADNPSRVSFNLSHCNLTKRSLEELFPMNDTPDDRRKLVGSLIKLDLSNNPLGDDGVLYLAQYFESYKNILKLEEINLSGVELSDNAVAKLADNLNELGHVVCSQDVTPSDENPIEMSDTQPLRLAGVEKKKRSKRYSYEAELQREIWDRIIWTIKVLWRHTVRFALWPTVWGTGVAFLVIVGLTLLTGGTHAFIFPLLMNPFQLVGLHTFMAGLSSGLAVTLGAVPPSVLLGLTIGGCFFLKNLHKQNWCHPEKVDFSLVGGEKQNFDGKPSSDSRHQEPKASFWSLFCCCPVETEERHRPEQLIIQM